MDPHAQDPATRESAADAEARPDAPRVVAPHPMRRLSDQVTAEGAHDDDRDLEWIEAGRVPTEDVFRRRFRLDLPLPRRPKEMAAELKSLRQALEGAYRRIAYLENLADTDPLVPAYNRRAFMRELNRAVAFSSRYDIPGSLIYVDINNLKHINDDHGHPAGDALIAHVAQILVRNVRQSDVVGRLGGDEFAVLLTHADEYNAARKGENLATMIADTPLEWNGGRVSVTVSWGVHGIKEGETPDEVLSGADKAMYGKRFGSGTD